MDSGHAVNSQKFDRIEAAFRSVGDTCSHLDQLGTPSVNSQEFDRIEVAFRSVGDTCSHVQ